MLMHICHSIFLFMLIGFYYKKKKISKTFLNCIWNNRKKEEDLFSLLWPEGPLPSPAVGPLGITSGSLRLLCARSHANGPSPARRGPSCRSRTPVFLLAPFSSLDPLTKRSHASAAVVFVHPCLDSSLACSARLSLS
jgi:hypothetical protein